jgi:Trypsin-co-occurring domain 1
MPVPHTEMVKTTLPNGATLYVETNLLGGEEEVSITLPEFNEVAHVLEGVAQSLVGALQKTKPRKASIEFGLEVALESGQLTALLVKGTGTSNLKVTLEWGETTE